jgi:hypothetical protein
MSSILVRIATTTVAALTLIMAAASPVQAATLTNCNDPGKGQNFGLNSIAA